VAEIVESLYPKSWDVLVVGGGPAGLAAAIAARRRGLSVLLADGATPPIDKPCGEGLMPEGIDALRNLGISIPESESYPFRGVRFVNCGIKAEAEFPAATACGIRRTQLHSILVEHASACGVRVMWRTAVPGLHAEGALLAGELVRARWVVGADGSSSRVRRWAKLDREPLSALRKRSLSLRSVDFESENPRFGFRRRYRLAPWSDFMELHWGRGCQIYVTPISHEEICVAMISSNAKLRIDNALEEFPELCAHLENGESTSSERGAITVTRRLRAVYRGRTALVGDASGGVDAITGEGLCLAFRQAALLGDCLAEGNLARYQKGHRALLRRPALMARMMLLMAKHSYLRRRTMQVFQSNPRFFAAMLAMHVGEGSARDHISNGIALGWELLTA
jgi:menaquinone-9 beta-reductase